MSEIVCKSYVEFYDELKKAKDNGKNPIQNDDHKSLHIGFATDDGNRYLVKIAEVKHAKDAGFLFGSYSLWSFVE